MRVAMRKHTYLATSLALLLLILTGSSNDLQAEGLAQESRPQSWKYDASLSDIYFVDQQHGWAVGSQGTLLRTEDGGKTWHQGNLQGKAAAKAVDISLSEKIQRSNARQWVGDKPVGDQAAPFSCRFESVCFIDSKNGWAVGGYDLPSMDYSRAVIARTSDGGRTWRSLPKLMIPRLHRIGLSSNQNAMSGWAVGEQAPDAKTSLFFTNSGGSIWSMTNTEPMPDWKDAQRIGNQFVGIDSDGQLAVFDAQKVQYSVVATQRQAVVNAVAMDPETQGRTMQGWAVGADGVILKTGNRGISWNPLHENVPALANFDFRCVHPSTSKVWFAGNPGGTLFSIDRSTNELRTHPLPRGTSINQIFFLNDSTGWVVGDFGLILATNDGGTTWKVQHTGSHREKARAGILAFCRSANDLPLNFIGKYAGDEDKLMAISVIDDRSSSTSFDTLRMSVERLGAAQVSAIQSSPDLDANEKLESTMRKLVREIRTLKPTILMGHAEALGERFETDRFLDQAIKMAASESAFPQQLAIGLSPWQVKHMLVTGEHGDTSLEPGMFLPRLGMLLKDMTVVSELAVGLPPQSNANGFNSWRYVGTGIHAQRQRATSNPIAQLHLPKRKSGSLPASSLSSIGRISQKRQQMQVLLQQQIRSPLSERNFKQSITQLTISMGVDRSGSETAGIWLFQLANDFLDRDQPELAAWTLEQLVSSSPRHALSPLASATLAKYYASDEMNLLAMQQWETIRHNINHADHLPSTSGPNVVIQKTGSGNRQVYRWNREALKESYANALKEAAEMPLELDVEEELKDFDPATVDLSLEVEDSPTDTEPAIQQVANEAALPSMTLADRTAFLNQRRRMAASHFARLGQRDPSVTKRSDFRFLQAHIVRQLSSAENADHYFRGIVKDGVDTEPTLLSAAMDETKPAESTTAFEAIKAEKRPHLDGLPNDVMWQEAMQQNATIVLKSGETASTNRPKDVAMVGWDEQHFYIHVRCYKLENHPYSDAATKRVRDANLSLRDRLRIFIDIDRDTSTAWQFGIDYRGQCHESCNGISSWNPKMYVANQQDDESWSVEIAIPFDQLSSKTIAELKMQPWRFGIERSDGPEIADQRVWWNSSQRPQTSMLRLR
jgi:photosystem II stability/assembly factor-like uncharacterized protein